MLNNFSMLTCLALICAATATAQSKLKVSAGQPNLPDKPKSEPGDEVFLDASSKEIVVRSRGVSLRIPERNKIDPIWACEVQKSGSQFSYECSMANGPNAQKRISGFGIQCLYPERVQSFGKDSWVPIPRGPAQMIFSIIFIHVVKDEDFGNHLTRGKIAGPFRLVSELLPGLVRVEVHAEQERSREAVSIQEGLDSISPWAKLRADELDTRERHVKYVFGIGPKVAPEGDSLKNIQSELAIASGLEGFELWSTKLRSLGRDEGGDIASELMSLPTSSSLATQFRQAMLWRLEALTRSGAGR